MEPSGVGAAQRVQPVGEGHQRQGRGQSKPQPCHQSAQQAGAEDANGNTDLATRRSRQALTQGHQIGVGLLIEPATARHILGVEVAQVRDGATKGGEPQARGHTEDFQSRPRMGLRYCARRLYRRLHWVAPPSRLRQAINSAVRVRGSRWDDIKRVSFIASSAYTWPLNPAMS